jgi:hypothetical protein
VARSIRLLSGNQETVVLRLDWVGIDKTPITKTTINNCFAFVGWKGSLSGESNEAAVCCDGHSVSRYEHNDTIEISEFLARSMGILKGKEPVYVTCTFVPFISRANKLEIQPCTPEDWEVRAFV